MLSPRANADVLEFYRMLPFNTRQSPQDAARIIARGNQVAASLPTLQAALAAGGSVLDVGCGCGWLTNTVARHSRCQVSGIDFNETAILFARQVAQTLGVQVEYLVGDLFRHAGPRHDVVVSNGVLHHTNDCLGGIRHLARNLLRPGGDLVIGLYHAHGRKPFLDHFAAMKAAGRSEEQMHAEFRRLRPDADDTHSLSWFKDQVLHPHETQHTLAEIAPLLEEEGLRLVAASVNGFKPFADVAELCSLEQGLEARGREALAQGRYFPGFFVLHARGRG